MKFLGIFGRKIPSKNSHHTSSEEESTFDAVSTDEDESSSGDELDDDILSQCSSESSSSTASSSVGTFPDQRAVVGVARHQRADTVRAVFHDPAFWRCLDNFQVECCFGFQDQADIFPSMSVHRGDPWMFESDLSNDHVAVTVEVGVDFYVRNE
jgi:hypothetical protein